MTDTDGRTFAEGVEAAAKLVDRLQRIAAASPFWRKETADELAKLAIEIRAVASPKPVSAGEVERAWPDIGIDPMKDERPVDRYEAAIARVREAYVKQQEQVPNQTALVWRHDIGTLLEMAIRLRSLLDDDGDAALTPNSAGRQETSEAQQEADAITVLLRHYTEHGAFEVSAETPPGSNQRVTVAVGPWVAPTTAGDEAEAQEVAEPKA